MSQADAGTGLELLIGYNEDEHLFDERQTAVLINAIDTCKILDPACGSGAFPMGILHKLVHILHKLDPQNKLWKERQIEKAQVIEDASIRDQVIEDIETAFNNNELDYGRKLYLIENCIYGIDIQPIATQISKLRFFISLIVDQKSDKAKENFGIRPLPNLETKFVAANTLIGIEKPHDQPILFDTKVQDMERELRDIRHRLFSAKTPATKRKLREEDQNLREQIGKLLEGSGWSNETAHQLAGWDPYDQNASSPFFDPEWMFGIIDSFNVVIGNPPYVQLQKDSGRLADLYKNSGYECFERTGDIYALFYEKGVELLRNDGHLCFITSNKWMRAGYGESLREYFLKKNPTLLIDLGPGVFENATVDTNILLIQNAPNCFSLKGTALLAETIEKDMTRFVNNNTVGLSRLTKHAWFIGSSEEQQLKEKIEMVGKPLNQWNFHIYRGVLTGLNEAFMIDQTTRDRIVAEDPSSANILKPLLRGRDIKRYRPAWAGLWLIHTGFDLNIPTAYPAVYKYLRQFEKKAMKRGDQGINWWNLRACVYYPEFDKERVVWSDIAVEPTFAWLGGGVYFNNTAYMICGAGKSLLGILNSSIIRWLFPKIASDLGQSGARYFKQFVNLLPVPSNLFQNRPITENIEQLIDDILKVKELNQGVDTGVVEKEVDRLVYQLYGLTDAEIAIIERTTESKG